MTGAAPVPDRPALWAALSNMQIEMPGASARFEEVLAGRQNWTLDFARRVTDEYRRFLYLAATAGSEVTPSQMVDEAWHLHLECPHYREILCGRILRRPLEHRPSTGAPGESERHHRQYEDTVALYERAFLRPPPADIWPRPLSWTERQAAEGRRRGRKAGTGLSAAAAIAALAAHLLGYPAVALILLGTAVVAALLSLAFFPAKAGSRNGCGGSSCGGSSCGGSSCGGGGKSPDGDGGDGGDGGSSCGGGCGGD